jgi:hypothetical protein
VEKRNTSALESFLILLPWASVPLLAMHIAATWNALPPRIAVHFDLQGRPNGWQSPSLFAGFALGLLIFLLTVLTYAMVRSFRVRSMSVVIVSINYVVVATIFALFWQIIDRAAAGGPMARLGAMPLILPVSALIFSIVCIAGLSAGRTQASPHAILIAEEQHRSPLAVFLVAPGLLVGLWMLSSSTGAPRLLGIFLLAVMGWIAIAMLDGFHYLVRTDGVQIKGFLLPLRFIPRSSIHTYRIEPWKGHGYGIRLTSNRTAYIWGGRNVVNISTDSGDVMLGHYHPECLIQDLDRMMQVSR